MCVCVCVCIARDTIGWFKGLHIVIVFIVYLYFIYSVLIIHVKRYRLSNTHLSYYKRSSHIRIPKYLNIGMKIYFLKIY